MVVSIQCIQVVSLFPSILPSTKFNLRVQVIVNLGCIVLIHIANEVIKGIGDLYFAYVYIIHVK